MKSSTRTGWLLSMMALSTLVACGDDVDEPTSSGSTGTIMGDGGGGGGGGGGGSGGEAGDLSGVQACVDICEQHKMYGCDPPDLDCDGSCRITIGLTGSACDDEMAAMYSCELPGAPSCRAPDECSDEHDAAFACIEASGCWGLECTYPNGLDGNDCACASTCLGKKHEVECGPSADGTTRCACLVDGVEVGTCEGAVKEVCHLKQGCCNEFFNIPL